MIDTSARTALAICDHCGHRMLRADRLAARTALAHHEADHHPDHYQARDTLAHLRAARKALGSRRSSIP